MLKYRGQYRVLFETDKAKKACEFTYVPCRIKKGSTIVRYSDTVLNAYVTSSKILNRLQKEYPDLFTAFQTGSSEGTLLFPESRIEEAATILKARVLGKNLNPRPKRKVVLSEEKRQELAERMRRINSSKFIGESSS